MGSNSKSWYAVDINGHEDTFKQLEISSSEGSVVGGGRGGISSQTYSGINLCEIDSLENVFRHGVDKPENVTCKSMQTILPQSLRKKPLLSDYFGNHGIDIYQEPEFDDFDPFADDPIIQNPKLKTCGDDRGVSLEEAFMNLLETQEHSLKGNQLSESCDGGIKTKKSDSKIPSDEFISTTAIIHPSTSLDYKSDAISSQSHMESVPELTENELDLLEKCDIFDECDNTKSEPQTDEPVDGVALLEPTPSQPKTIGEEILCEDFIDEAIMPTKVTSESVFMARSSGNLPSIVETESEDPINDTFISLDAINDNVNTSDDVNANINNVVEKLSHKDIGSRQGSHVILSPPISKESESILAKITSADALHAGIRSPVVIQRTLSPTKLSNEDIFLDAAQDMDETVLPEQKPESRTTMRRKSSGNINEPFLPLKTVSSMENKLESKKSEQSSVAADTTELKEAEGNITNNNETRSSYIETCTKVFQKLFQMHVSEVAIPEVENVVDLEEETPFVIPPDTSKSCLTTPSKKLSVQNIPMDDHPTPPMAEFQELIDDELMQYVDPKIAPEQENSDKIRVQIEVQTNDLDTNGNFLKRNVTREFPLLKDDTEAALIPVNNPHLQHPKIQYVNTPSEIVYHLPREISVDCKHCIGTFKVRCSLTIPVSFKLSSVYQLELVPQAGIVLPNQTVDIQVYSQLGPEKYILERLKVEGILLFAAPFVFNRGRDADNITHEDVEKFWSYFCGPHFQFAQTRFIFVQVYIQHKDVALPMSTRDWIWKRLKYLNYFEFRPESKPFLSYPSVIFRNKQLSPLGQMVLRRRQSLTLQAHEQAEKLNDCRTTLILGLILLIVVYSLYYLTVFRPFQLSEEDRLQARWSWGSNVRKCFSNLLVTRSSIDKSI